MRPKPLPSRGDDLSRPRLDAIIDVRHPLVQLAGLIDWARFDAAFGSLYAETGRPGLPTRLMVGLHLLKHMKGLSDEEVCAQWVENPYLQAFCGEAVFRHVLPLDRSSLTRWRTRIGADPLEELLAETIAAATRSEALPPARLERVTIDTSVQTKAVAHPTDSHLLLRGIEWLNRLARKQCDLSCQMPLTPGGWRRKAREGRSASRREDPIHLGAATRQRGGAIRRAERRGQ